ncbi:UNVERIFIED_CONTAM: hypothetical protein HDU68_010855 [Siphonaria sp. JEL0065]|nr:hypothetical protein HDU68_010855 [Siphonaria sp. JEL0065]
MAVNANFERINGGKPADNGLNQDQLAQVQSQAQIIPPATTTSFIPAATGSATFAVINGTTTSRATITSATTTTILGQPTAAASAAPTITAPATFVKRADIDNSNLTVIFDTSLNVLSINQLDVSSPWYWLPTALTWVVSIFFYIMLFRLVNVYNVYRQEYFNSTDFQHSFQQKTLLITELPDNLRSDAALSKFLSSRPDLPAPSQSIVNRNIPHLGKLIAEHEKVTRQLESVLAKYLKDPTKIPAKRPTLNIGNDPIRGLTGTVDAIRFLGDTLNDLEEKIYFYRAQPDSEHAVNSSGFASYDNVIDAHEAAQGFSISSVFGKKSSRNANALNVKLSPKFDDIIWENIGINQAERFTRRMFGLGMTVGISVGWILLAGLISSLSNLSSLFAGNKPTLDWLAANPKAKAFLQSYLAPILLAVLNYLLPIVLRLTTVWQGAKSHAGVERSVLYKLFTFYMIQIFLFAAVSALITAFKQQVPDGVSITDELKLQITGAITGLAGNSNFYIALLASYYAGYGIEIIQGIPLVLNFIKRKFYRLTPRDNFELNKPPVFDFTRIYGTLLIAFTIALTFAIVAPIILPFTALFFGLVFVVMKYQLMYVYAVKNESHGSYFLKVFNLLIFAAGFFQFLTLTVIFAANKAKSTNANSSAVRQWMIIAPLPFLSLALWIISRIWLLPKATYCTSSLTVASLRPSSTQSSYDETATETSTIATTLEDKVLNPALVKPLMKVWVPKESAHLLANLHTPRYANIEEYEIAHPEVALGSNAAAKHRKAWIKGLPSLAGKKKELAQLKATAAAGGLKKRADGDDDEDNGERSSSESIALGERNGGHYKSTEFLVNSGGEASGEDLLPPEEMEALRLQMHHEEQRGKGYHAGGSSHQGGNVLGRLFRQQDPQQQQQPGRPPRSRSVGRSASASATQQAPPARRPSGDRGHEGGRPTPPVRQGSRR